MFRLIVPTELIRCEDITYFLIASTGVLLLIGAGLASKSVGFFQTYKFNKGVGGDVSETGDGPGSYDVDG